MPSRLHLALLVAIAFVVVVPAGQPAAQVLVPNPSNVEAQGTAFRYYTVPGALNIRVLLVGPSGTGIYTVAEETTLTELLALSGGAEGAVETQDSRRDVTVRLLRGQGEGIRTVVYEAPLEQVLLESDVQPQILTGDIVEVQVSVRPSRRQALRDGLQIASTAGTIVLLVLQLSRSRF